MVADLGTLWPPSDSMSDDYFEAYQLWWGHRLMDGRHGSVVGI